MSNYHIFRPRSLLAIWSKRLAFLSLQLLIFTILLHRFGPLQTPAALNLFALGLVGGMLAIFMALGSFVRIWKHGFLGLKKAVGGLIIGVIIFAYPATQLPSYFSLPNINDITTDYVAPPSFAKLSSRRGPLANSIIYPGDNYAEQQIKAYPDIRPIILDRSNQEAFDLVQEALQRLKWPLVYQQKPKRDGTIGRLETIDKTLLLGFVDDIVIRITGDENAARIDIRSASRFGRHDLGRNATRIRQLIAEVRSGLVKGENPIAASLEKEDIPLIKTPRKRKKYSASTPKKEKKKKVQRPPLDLPETQRAFYQ